VTSYFWERLSFLLLILPNYAFILYDLPYWCAQAWSIGVEEQFYYLWPWLIKYPKRRWIIIVLFLAVTAGVLWTGLYYLQAAPEEKLRKVMAFIGQFRLQVMAFGGFLAWLVFSEKQHITAFLFRKDMQCVVYTLTLLLFLSGIHFVGFMEVYGLLFGFFVVNLACNPNSIIRLESPWISYLGKISYGIYLFHVVATVFTINVLSNFALNSSALYNVLLYSGTIVLTIGICVASYEWMEKPLLAYKDRKFGR
jgi:peptidoglycan/LPS O-acetylase OafA/YrhL